MDLTTYMIITSIYWTIAFYYPFKTKRVIFRVFWLPMMAFIVIRLILYIVILIILRLYTRK